MTQRIRVDSVQIPTGRHALQRALYDSDNSDNTENTELDIKALIQVRKRYRASSSVGIVKKSDTALHCTALLCNVQYCIELCNTTAYITTFYCLTINCIALDSTNLPNTIQYNIIQYTALTVEYSLAVLRPISSVFDIVRI